jgi:four helix bundle protein
MFWNEIMEQRKFDLEDRLVKFACQSLEICELLPNTRSGQNLEYQLSKSSTSSALGYGEAQAAESKADFIHKVKIVLKELRESGINLRIIIEKPVLTNEKLHIVLKEANELIAIFLKSVETAKQNLITEKLKK